MCTIITANSDINRTALVARIMSDSLSNSDGYSMLMVLKTGKPLNITSLDVEAITNLIELMDYERVFIHTRFATHGVSALQNCHGWNAGGTYIFHNGSIRSKIADKFEVDSMAIKYWIENYGLNETLDKLSSEPFANVFLVDLDEKSYVVHRSSTGSLYTDGRGNYSTSQFDTVNLPVEPDTFEVHDLACENSNDLRGTGGYTDWTSQYDTQEKWDKEPETLDDYSDWLKRPALGYGT